MRRSVIDLVTDALSLVAILATTATGLLLKYVLPPRSGGAGRGGGLTLWDWSRHDWGDLHFYLAVALLALLLVHVTLHWHWITVAISRLLLPRRETVQAPRPSARHVAAASFLALLLVGFAGFIWAASAQVERRAGPAAPARHARMVQSDESDVTSGENLHGGRGHGMRGWRGGR